MFLLESVLPEVESISLFVQRSQQWKAEVVFILGACTKTQNGKTKQRNETKGNHRNKAKALKWLKMQ